MCIAHSSFRHFHALICFRLSSLEKKAKWVTPVLDPEQLHEETEDDDEQSQPEVHSDPLLHRRRLSRDEDGQRDDAEPKQAI